MQEKKETGDSFVFLAEFVPETQQTDQPTCCGVGPDTSEQGSHYYRGPNAM